MCYSLTLPLSISLWIGLNSELFTESSSAWRLVITVSPMLFMSFSFFCWIFYSSCLFSSSIKSYLSSLEFELIDLSLRGFSLSGPLMTLETIEYFWASPITISSVSSSASSSGKLTSTFDSLISSLFSSLTSDFLFEVSIFYYCPCRLSFICIFSVFS